MVVMVKFRQKACERARASIGGFENGIFNSLLYLFFGIFQQDSQKS
jgi:hypothetical protein